MQAQARSKKMENSFFLILALAFTLGFGFAQGSYRSWKTWKVMEFYDFIFHAWKVMEFRCGSWKGMENDVNFTKFII